MRLVSFNLLHGRSGTDGRVDPERLRTAGEVLAADVLALQEVDRNQPRSGCLDLTATVADGMGVDERSWCFAPALYGTPGGRWESAADGIGEDTSRDARPAYGIGLLCRLPVQQWHLVRLGRVPVKSPVAVPGPHIRVLFVDDEPRIGLAAVVQTPAGQMTVATTHLSFVPGWNVIQLLRLVHALGRLPEPIVLLGDLNLPGAIPTVATRWRPLARASTYPAQDPRIQLDHVLARGTIPPVRQVRTELLELSDHRALVVDLETDHGDRRVGLRASGRDGPPSVNKRKRRPR